MLKTVCDNNSVLKANNNKVAMQILIICFSYFRISFCFLFQVFLNFLLKSLAKLFFDAVIFLNQIYDLSLYHIYYSSVIELQLLKSLKEITEMFRYMQIITFDQHLILKHAYINYPALKIIGSRKFFSTYFKILYFYKG